MMSKNEESSSEEITFVKATTQNVKPIKTKKTNNVIEIISSDEEEQLQELERHFSSIGDSNPVKEPVQSKVVPEVLKEPITEVVPASINSTVVTSQNSSLVETPRTKRVKPNSPAINKNQESILNYIKKKEEEAVEIDAGEAQTEILNEGLVAEPVVLEQVVLSEQVLVAEQVSITEEKIIAEQVIVEQVIAAEPLAVIETPVSIIEEPVVVSEPVVEEINEANNTPALTPPTTTTTNVTQAAVPATTSKPATPLTKQQIAAEKKIKAQLLKEQKAKERAEKAAIVKAEKEKAALEKAEKLKADRLKAEQQRLVAQQQRQALEQQRQEKLKLEKLKLEQEKAEKARLEELAKLEKARLDQLRADQLKAQKMAAEKAKQAAEQAKAEASGKTRVIIRDTEEEYVHYLDEDDTLEDILEERGITKVKYNGLPVSKYLTLEEIGFDKEDPYFDVIEEGNNDLTLKVNVDHFVVKNIKIGKNKRVDEIFEKCEKTGIIVMNGILIDNSKKIKDVFENNDVIDVIQL